MSIESQSNGSSSARDRDIPGDYFRKDKYEIISLVAYLIGVDEEIFKKEHSSPKYEVYKRCQREKAARIIRHLCLIRTKFEQYFRDIRERMTRDKVGIYGMTDYIPEESLFQLERDGVPLTQWQNNPVNYIIEINLLINDRINNCKFLFPVWLNWDYIKSLFIMPNGHSVQGTAVAANLYYENKNLYPYGMYINWMPQDEGNILYNDEKFVTLLYSWNNDIFSDVSKLSDATENTKQSISDFITQGRKVIFIVDCENSDPYRFMAMLSHLRDHLVQKVTKIILVDDVHTSSGWQALEDSTAIPIERQVIERVKEDKSLVDITLTTMVCREVFGHNVDSVVLVSSDSDYWGMINQLPEVKFMVLVEAEKCSPSIKRALYEHGIFFAYLNDFYSGESYQFQIDTILDEVRKYLDQAISGNVNEMMSEAFRIARVRMPQAEQNQFYQKYIQNMYLDIEKDGTMRIRLKNG